MHVQCAVILIIILMCWKNNNDKINDKWNSSCSIEMLIFKYLQQGCFNKKYSLESNNYFIYT